MAFVFRGEIANEEIKNRATQRLYQLLPNHKCPQKDCPFHPPEEALEEEDIIQIPKKEPPEDTVDPEEESAPSDYDSVLTADSGVGREREDFSDGGEVVVTRVSPLPELRHIEEDEEVIPQPAILDDSEHDADDEEKEETRRGRRERESVDSALPSWPSIPDTQTSDYRLQVAPEFTATLKNRRVSPGLSLHLYCSVTGIPDPQVRWFKDGREIYTGLDYNIKNNYGLLTLEVVKVAEKHGGVYTCEATNEEGSSSCHATVAVECEEEVPTIQVDLHRPRFLLPLQDTLVAEGDDVTLACQAIGKPMPTFKWQKDMHHVTSSSRVQMTSQEDGTCTLKIRGVRVSDAGLYMALAKSPSGRCQSSATLRVRGRGSISRSHSQSRDQSGFHESCLASMRVKAKAETAPTFSLLLPQSLDVHEGDSLRLDCSVQGYPTPIVSWYKNHRGLMYGPRHRIMFVGWLHTMEIPHTMALDGGDYIVRAVNSCGTVETVCTVRMLPPRSSGQASPRRRSISELIRTAPYFTKTLPSTVEVSEGDNFRLDCLTREGIELVPWSRDTDFDQSESQEDDARADNSKTDKSEPEEIENGDAKDSDTSSRQFVSQLPPSVEVMEGENASLSCAVPQPFTRITWYKDGKRLSFFSQRLSSETDEKGHVVLHVTDAQTTDGGLYRCVATMPDRSSVESSTRLHVKDAERREAPCFVQELRDMEAEDGDTVEVVVEVKDTDQDTSADM